MFSSWIPISRGRLFQEGLKEFSTSSNQCAETCPLEISLCCIHRFGAPSILAFLGLIANYKVIVYYKRGGKETCVLHTTCLWL